MITIDDSGEIAETQREKLLDEIFTSAMKPRTLTYKGVLYTPQEDGSYTPPLPEELVKILDA